MVPVTADWTTAKDFYQKGYIDRTEWDLYQFYWRNSVYRYSNVSYMYEVRSESAKWDWQQNEWVSK